MQEKKTFKPFKHRNKPHMDQNTFTRLMILKRRLKKKALAQKSA